MSVRRGYLVLTWPSGSSAARERVCGLVEQMADRPAWRRVAAADRLLVWTTVRDPLPVRVLPESGGVVIGTAFAMPNAASGPPAATVQARARALSCTLWGDYVALLHGQGEERSSLYRAPSGGLVALCWSLPGGVEVVASGIGGWPTDLGPRRPFLNWDRIAEFVAVPQACSTPSLFDDVTAVGPGDLQSLGAPVPPPIPVWTPVAFVQDPIGDRRFAAEELVRRVEACTTDLVGGYARVLLEVSGGLDSAILAGTLGDRGLGGRVAEAVNITFGRPESDETGYAQAVADHLGVALTSVAHQPDALDPADFAELAGELRPSANGVDPKWDRDEIARLRATGAQAIVSGQGGDAVFLQMPSALIAADAFARDGLRTLFSPVLADVARRARQPVWSVIAEARAARRAPPLFEAQCSSLVSDGVRAAARGLAHSWLRQARAADVLPGKQLHIWATANFLLNPGPARRRREADILFPLFAQPVLEHCLRIPTPWLGGAAYDRAFARQAFADRIPEVVQRRRAKGLVTVYFSKLVANSLDVLRPHLLDGNLCRAGVLDRRAVETALSRDHLIWAAKPSDILWAAAAEAWVRHWQTRVPDSLQAPRRG